MFWAKTMLGACALCLATLPAKAATYDVDLLLDDYTYTSVNGSWVYTAGADPVSIIGQVETDGTLGAIGADNILSWSFNISSTTGSQDISSAGLFGAAHTYGIFEATSAQLLTGLGSWGFLEYVNAPTSYVIGRVHGNNGALHTHANFRDLSIDCSTGTCSTTSNQGNLGIERNLQLLGTAETSFSSFTTTQVVTNPVPASLPLILSAFGFLGFLGWRRRRETA